MEFDILAKFLLKSEKYFQNSQEKLQVKRSLMFARGYLQNCFLAGNFVSRYCQNSQYTIWDFA